MDLAVESLRLRLDDLAVRLSAALDLAGVPHALIKGPSTSTWLYDPPRAYSDVDLLVPASRVEDAAAAMAEAGLASPQAGGAGEEAPHSYLLHTPDGLEVDLHLSLPAVPPDGDRLWDGLREHVAPFAMDVGTVPALDVAGRCLVLALHSLEAGPTETVPHDDLDRAWQRCGPEVWVDVRRLADQIGIGDLVDAGLSRCDPDLHPSTRRARLHVSDAPPLALGAQRLLDTPGRRRVQALAREVVPTRGFMAHAAQVESLHGRDLALAHLRRWRRLARQLPSAARAWRDSR